MLVILADIENIMDKYLNAQTIVMTLRLSDPGFHESWAKVHRIFSQQLFVVCTSTTHNCRIAENMSIRVALIGSGASRPPFRSPAADEIIT
jgi:hypothetical protein